MKTPRELLLERHSEVETKLAAMTSSLLTALSTDTPHKPRVVPAPWILRVPIPWRWQLSSLAGAWFIVVSLKLATPNPGVGSPAQNLHSSPAEARLAREERTQLTAELSEVTGFQKPSGGVLRPRSQAPLIRILPWSMV